MEPERTANFRRREKQSDSQIRKLDATPVSEPFLSPALVFIGSYHFDDKVWNERGNNDTIPPLSPSRNHHKNHLSTLLSLGIVSVFPVQKSRRANKSSVNDIFNPFFEIPDEAGKYSTKVETIRYASC